MTDIKIACDYDMWLPVPKDWPWQDYRNVDAWADKVGQAFAEAYGWDQAARAWCTEAVKSLSESTGAEEWRHVYIDPEARWMYGVSVFWHPSRDDDTVEEFAGTGDPHAIRPIQRSDFVTEHLGTGVRTVRYVDSQTPRHEVIGILQFGFRVRGTDVLVVASSHDLVLHEELMPAVDDFVRTISVL